MVCAPVRSIIPSLKLGDYLSVQVHKPCSISCTLHNLPSALINIKRPVLYPYFRAIFFEEHEICCMTGQSGDYFLPQGAAIVIKK